MSLHYLFERGLPEDYWVLEWDELRFVLKDPAGQVMIKADAAAAHRLLGVHELHAPGVVRLATAVGPLTFRAHPDSVSELRALVGVGLRSDAEYRRRLKRDAQWTLLSGLALFIGGCALFVLLIGCVTQFPEPPAGHWVLFFAVAWLIRPLSFLLLGGGCWGLYLFLRGTRRLMRLRRIEREGAAEPQPAGRV